MQRKQSFFHWLILISTYILVWFFSKRYSSLLCSWYWAFPHLFSVTNQGQKVSQWLATCFFFRLILQTANVIYWFLENSKKNVSVHQFSRFFSKRFTVNSRIIVPLSFKTQRVFVSLALTGCGRWSAGGIPLRRGCSPLDQVSNEMGSSGTEWRRRSASHRCPLLQNHTFPSLRKTERKRKHGRRCWWRYDNALTAVKKDLSGEKVIILPQLNSSEPSEQSCLKSHTLLLETHSP